jgi:hypothetical protein
MFHALLSRLILPAALQGECRRWSTIKTKPFLPPAVGRNHAYDLASVARRMVSVQVKTDPKNAGLLILWNQKPDSDQACDCYRPHPDDTFGLKKICNSVLM